MQWKVRRARAAGPGEFSIAVHEAAHAVVALHVMGGGTTAVRHVSIIKDSTTLGRVAVVSLSCLTKG